MGTADARDAALEFGDPAPTRVDGQLTWDLFSREGGSTIWPLFGDDVHQAQCRVVMTWTPCHRYDTGRWEGAFSGRLL